MMEITGQTTVRDLLAAHPQAVAVLAARGMCEDCKKNPPPVPLATFAAKHCGGDLEGLLGELRGAMA